MDYDTQTSIVNEDDMDEPGDEEGQLVDEDDDTEDEDPETENEEF